MAIEERFKGVRSVDAGLLSPYWGEHAARYKFALPFIEGKSVLDIACGTGYGIGLMCDEAALICGVDVDPDAVIQARRDCAKNSAVLLGDGLSLPFADGCFRVITSFETIEHLDNRSGFLCELDRVLSRDGVLLLSTPNATYTRPLNGKPTNPFHVYEYTPDELRSEMEKFFSVETLLGQYLENGNGISPFYIDQQRLPRDVGTQLRLFGWRLMNKMPLTIREGLSDAIWKKPFYPTAADYVFSTERLDQAPVQVAVCRKK